jgi:ribosome recycling factor
MPNNLYSNKFLEKASQAAVVAVNFLSNDLKSLRTNRVSGDLVKNIKIDVYGVYTPLEQLASLSIAEPRIIVIDPWDKNILKSIEKALSEAKLGSAPTAKEGKIYLHLPPLSEETRKNLIKILKEKVEKGKKSLRAIRDEARSAITNLTKEKEISEDERFNFLKELDHLIRTKEDEVEDISQRKEREVMTV